MQASNALSWSVEWQEGIVDLTACLVFEPTDSAALKLKAQVAPSLPPQASTHPPTHPPTSAALAHTHTPGPGAFSCGLSARSVPQASQVIRPLMDRV